jgi:hypothetical protein
MTLTVFLADGQALVLKLLNGIHIFKNHIFCIHSICPSCPHRINTVQITSEHASRYNTSYTTEMNWLDSVDSKSKNLQLVEGSAKRKINPHMVNV